VEKMESAKKNLQLIDSSAEIRPQRDQSEIEESLALPRVNNLQKIEISKFIRGEVGGREQQVGEKVTKTLLINKLNYVNFQDGTLLINFRHRKYQRTTTLLGKPQPCLGDTLECLWTESFAFHRIQHTYDFENFLLADGNKLLMVEPEVVQMDDKGISLHLPDLCYEVSSRASTRHLCEGVTVQLIQNSSLFTGKLLDFNASALRVELKTVNPQTFDWITHDNPVNIILSNEREILYSGECNIIRNTSGQQTRTYILEPLRFEIQRFKNKEYRSYRYELTPSPNIIFRHPFTNSMFDLKVIDLSGLGFAVEEDEDKAVLLPGMILPEIELNFANSFRINCKAQVVYRKLVKEEKDGNWVKCGLALLDIDSHDHVKLLALLHQSKDRDSYICNKVNMDELWDFLFETGFIYPHKYAFIQKNKAEIKKTYEKLYTQNPHIARHFIYQKRGRIMGHMAMIRFYNKTWLIHHHAARKSALNKAGLTVLDQVGRLGNASHNLLSLHMDHLMCYYRPENKFPSRVFGGAAKSINDPLGCSIDTFAYYHHQKKPGIRRVLPPGWQLSETHADDLQELESFYQYLSGGIMIEALDLKPELVNIDNLSREYTGLGLTRGRQLYSLRKNGQLTAVVMVNIADLGLNLSDLTNCIKIFVVDGTSLPRDIFTSVISTVAESMLQDEIPVLLYPADYADNQNIAYEKHYNLWVINLQYTDPYFKYLNRLLRFV
jgi:hypothetical protein